MKKSYCSRKLPLATRNTSPIFSRRCSAVSIGSSSFSLRPACGRRSGSCAGPRLGEDSTLLCIPHQGQEAIEAMDELAVGESDEEAEDHAQMDREQARHERRVAQEEECQAGEAGQEQHGEERHIHAETRRI